MYNEISLMPIELWIIVGFAIFFLLNIIYFSLLNSGFFDMMQDRIAHKKRELGGEWHLNLAVLLFGKLAIIFIVLNDSFKFWLYKHSKVIILTVVNIVMLVPVVLLLTGVIEKLPEIFFILFVIYIFVMLAMIISIVDDKKRGYVEDHNKYNYYDHYYPNCDKAYGYGTSTKDSAIPSYVRYASREISEKVANERKQKIRDKLSKNKKLKTKYNL